MAKSPTSGSDERSELVPLVKTRLAILALSTPSILISISTGEDVELW